MLTVLHNGKSGADQIAGTNQKPVVQSDIEVSSCVYYKIKGQAKEGDRAEMERQQAGVDRLIAEGVNNGSLQAQRQASGYANANDSNSLLQLQMQMMQQQAAQAKAGTARQTAANSKPAENCAMYDSISQFGKKAECLSRNSR